MNTVTDPKITTHTHTHTHTHTQKKNQHIVLNIPIDENKAVVFP